MKKGFEGSLRHGNCSGGSMSDGRGCEGPLGNKKTLKNKEVMEEAVKDPCIGKVTHRLNILV